MSLTRREPKMSPLLKYPGGKENELPFILPYLPENAARYFEPFAGGGAVFFATECGQSFLNDKSAELMRIYRMAAEGNQFFFKRLTELDQCWQLLTELAVSGAEELAALYGDYKREMPLPMQANDRAASWLLRHAHELAELEAFDACPGKMALLSELSESLASKMSRMHALEEKKGSLLAEDVCKNLEAALKNGFYMHLRDIYNHAKSYHADEALSAAAFYFIREYCYSSMFRYNREGEFNVPYGGISYNRKRMSDKIDYLQSGALREKLSRAEISALDFAAFFRKYQPETEDFVFLDPPYDTAFSTYSRMTFGEKEHRRLAAWLLRKCRARFMLIIQNTELIRSLYQDSAKAACGRRLCVRSFSAQYRVSFRDRNKRSAEHLIVTNYPLPAMEKQLSLGDF